MESQLISALVIAIILAQVSSRTVHQKDTQKVGCQPEWTQFNRLEDIVADTKKRKEAIDPKLQHSGSLKYLISTDNERKRLTLLSGNMEEIKQHEKDTLAIESIVFSDPEIYNIFSELNEFIEGSVFSHEGHGNPYWTQEKKLQVIRELDAKFANVPEWGRFWHYTFDKTLSFMQKYG